MANRQLLVLPSPLLPAQVYSTLADALSATGLDGTVAETVMKAGDTAADLVLRWSEVAHRADVVLAHSNAGLLAPAVRSHIRTEVPIIFTDAALPPATGSTRLAPAAFRAMLGELAGPDGELPPWTRWWTREDLAEVIPDGRFDAIDAACPRLTLGWFDQQIDAPADWSAGPNAYLAFGDTYAAELDFARDQGWPHDVLDGAHLHFLHRPLDVATAVHALLERLR